MRKQKLPPFDELIQDLVNSIKLRNPEKNLDEVKISAIRNHWLGNDKKLYEFVKKLRINENKVKSIQDSYEEREVEFIVGNTLSGEPIIVKHLIQQQTFFKKQTNAYAKKIKSRSVVFKTKAFRSLFNM